MLTTIGRIDLYEGDCQEICRNLPSKSVDMIFTDPPYGHHHNNGDLIHRREEALGRRREEAIARPLLNDDPNTASHLVWWCFQEASRLLVPGGVICCCCSGGGPDPQFARWSTWMDEILEFKQMIVWDKGPMGMGWHYRRSYETILVGQKPGASCKWYDTTNRMENILRPGQYGIRKIIPMVDQHPTEKPWQLAAHFIKLHTQLGDLVLDPFMGSGSTLVACHHLERRGIGIEQDPAWAHKARTTVRALREQRSCFDPE